MAQVFQAGVCTCGPAIFSTGIKGETREREEREPAGEIETSVWHAARGEAKDVERRDCEGQLRDSKHR